MPAKPARNENLLKNRAARQGEPGRAGGLEAFSLVETLIALGVVASAITLFAAAALSGDRETRDLLRNFEARQLADAIVQDLRLSARDSAAKRSAVFQLAPLPGDPALNTDQSLTLYLAKNWRPTPREQAYFIAEIRWSQVPGPESFAPTLGEVRVRQTTQSRPAVSRIFAIPPPPDTL